MAGGDPLAQPAADLTAALIRLGVLRAGERITLEPLAGGVSSDIWRVDLPSGPVCVKRALARLKVSQVWEAPVERNRYEFLWLQTVAAISPRWVPALIADSAADQLFVMAYLEPGRYPVWKQELSHGVAAPAFAAQVGEALAEIHLATAHRPDLAAQFETDRFFHALRLEPYLEARAAALLPGLLLARVDGKSPVEYLTTDTQREPVRRVARQLLGAPVRQLSALAHAWRTEISS